MKKIFRLLFVLTFIFSLTCTAVAAEETEVINAPAPVENGVIPDFEDTESAPDTQSGLHARMSEGEPGRGETEDLYKYWEIYGYPEYVSFAFETGGEMLEDGTGVSWWDIGVVNAGEKEHKEILDLASPQCRITFVSCAYSYSERKAVMDEITALNDKNIGKVMMIYNTEKVCVVMAGGTSDKMVKRYAEKFAGEYGAIVDVIGAEQCADDAFADGLDKGGAEVGYLPAFVAVMLLLTAALTAFFVRRRRPVPVPTDGIAGNTGVKNLSAKDTEELVQKSMIKPGENVYDALMREIDEK